MIFNKIKRWLCQHRNYVFVWENKEYTGGPRTVIKYCPRCGMAEEWATFRLERDIKWADKYIVGHMGE